jgi:hypothetical protein
VDSSKGKEESKEEEDIEKEEEDIEEEEEEDIEKDKKENEEKKKEEEEEEMPQPTLPSKIIKYLIKETNKFCVFLVLTPLYIARK